ncbi:MAG: DUF6265 family protein [Fimbriimonadaceae bacterium]
MITTAILLASTLLQSPTEPIKAKIEQLDFMVGHWEGYRGPAWIQEIWTKPKDGIMAGAFLMHQDGKLVFSESERIVQEGEFIKLKVKHFNSDFSAIEEKDKTSDFNLVSIAPNTATFHHIDQIGNTWLTYKRTENSTNAWLHDGTNPPKDELIFKFKLVK